MEEEKEGGDREEIGMGEGDRDGRREEGGREMGWRKRRR